VATGRRCERARQNRTGSIKGETRPRQDREADRSDGPAHITRDAATGVVTNEAWWKDGERHRADRRHIVRKAATGVVIREEWWKDGKRLARPSAVAAK
jgi:hypothetical protein